MCVCVCVCALVLNTYIDAYVDITIIILMIMMVMINNLYIHCYDCYYHHMLFNGVNSNLFIVIISGSLS